MEKKISILLGFVLVFSLAACGSGQMDAGTEMEEPMT